eukprot:CAMPEP_0116131052 /NCGR_PEP_ID=MMETSP0329-20121206/8803_1 /TAXON_ID=697910 /ORGANISM="Pseudo-nitzschia arenysensis, Strain B593" /LENGTH=495 /DNA_ID=CAMNT_0003625463 /DNA_START=279 /DNA_END=1766 /DNA_ORIENTATION=+
MTDVGYYKGLAYVVMHLMPDPMQVKSCTIDAENGHPACIEADNMACSHTIPNQKCVNTETTELEWSDVTAFFQFGFRLRTGIVVKTLHDVHTSDWLGPYHMIMAPIGKHHEEELDNVNQTKPLGDDKKELWVSRYVNTPQTKDQLQRPFANSGIFDNDAKILEDIVGLKAINETIHQQIHWRGTPKDSASFETEERTLRGSLKAPSDDPYAQYAHTCAHGNLKPILPRLEVVKITHPPEGDNPPKHNYHLKVHYPMLSVPKAADPVYKLWPTMKNHLGPQFPVKGPYCYGKDPNRAWTIDLAFDSSKKPEEAIWKGVHGCVAPWPCWSGDPQPPALPPSQEIPEENGTSASYVLDPKGIEFIIVYAVGLLLVISLVFNCKLANKLKSMQQSARVGRDFHQVNAANRYYAAQQQQQTHQIRTPGQPNRSQTPARGVSYRNYLREAVEGGQNNNNNNDNSLEEPLLTASTSTASDDTDRVDNTEPAAGVEESKQEAE